MISCLQNFIAKMKDESQLFEVKVMSEYLLWKRCSCLAMQYFDPIMSIYAWAQFAQRRRRR